MIRPQYHLRDSPEGLLAWDVKGLIERTRSLPSVRIKLSKIAELDENYWYPRGLPTGRSIVEHLALIEAADLDFPIILDASGRLMDGMHRVCKALARGEKTILAVQLEQTPEPDYVGVSEEDLPYDA